VERGSSTKTNAGLLKQGQVDLYKRRVLSRWVLHRKRLGAECRQLLFKGGRGFRREYAGETVSEKPVAEKKTVSRGGSWTQEEDGGKRAGEQ